MPMVIPVIAAFASVSAGVAAIGAVGASALSIVAGYAMVAGGILTGVGALTGNKSLMKIGGVLSLGGALGGLAGSAMSAASGATDAASAGAVNGLDAASDAASAASAAGGVEGGTNLFAYDAANMAGSASQAGGEAAAAIDGGTNLFAQAAPQATQAGSGSISDLAMQNTGAGALESGAGAAPMPISQPNIGSASPAGAGAYSAQPSVQPVSTASTTVQNAASNMTGPDLASWWQKAQQTGKGVADFLSKNKELVKIGGDMMASMYGPQAEKLDMEKSLMERARANLNSPVQLKFVKPGG